MGPIWGRQDQGGPHDGPVNFAVWDKSFQTITARKIWCISFFHEIPKITSALVDTEIWIFDTLYICYQHWRFTDDHKIQVIGCFHDIRANFTVKWSLGSSTLKRKYYFDEISVTSCIGSCHLTTPDVASDNNFISMKTYRFSVMNLPGVLS